MPPTRCSSRQGIRLNEFLSLYGTEDQCFDALCQWRWPDGFVCPHCGHDRCCQSSPRKLQQCNHCHRQTSITAGTLFEATKLSLTVWFQAIDFMTQDKKGGSATKLHRHKKSHLGDGRRTLSCSHHSEPVRPGFFTVVASNARAWSPPSPASATPRSRNRATHLACSQSPHLRSRFNNATSDSSALFAPRARTTVSRNACPHPTWKQHHAQQILRQAALAQTLQRPGLPGQLLPALRQERRHHLPTLVRSIGIPCRTRTHGTEHGHD